MNKKAIINKYKNLTDPLLILKGNRIVVGEEVDENNQLFYVIKDTNGTSVESAWNQPVIFMKKKNTEQIIQRSTIIPQT